MQPITTTQLLLRRASLNHFRRRFATRHTRIFNRFNLHRDFPCVPHDHLVFHRFRRRPPRQLRVTKSFPSKPLLLDRFELLRRFQFDFDFVGVLRFVVPFNGRDVRERPRFRECILARRLDCFFTRGQFGLFRCRRAPGTPASVIFSSFTAVSPVFLTTTSYSTVAGRRPRQPSLPEGSFPRNAVPR